MESGAGDPLRLNDLHPVRRDLRRGRRRHHRGIQCRAEYVAVQFLLSQLLQPAKAIFALILPHIDTTGDRTSGITMETPKGLAKTLVDEALENPELNRRIQRYAQIPGTFSRSRDELFPMENTYRSLGFAPWWFFGGFREVALGAMFYHHVISPFGMLESSRDFISPKAAQLTIDQRRLRRRQAEIRLALASAHNRGSSWWQLSGRRATPSADRMADASSPSGHIPSWTPRCVVSCCRRPSADER